MARYRGQKALYEVIGKNRRHRNGDTVVVHPEPESDASGTIYEEPTGIPSESRWRRPRSVQLNAGNIELTVSYLVAAVCGLILLLGLLGAYRLGQWVAVNRNLAKPAIEAREPASMVPSSFENSGNDIVGEPGSGIGNAATEAEAQDTARKSESPRNAIGILTYRDRTQLVPVKEYFRSRGIETEIIRVDSGFILVTAERFHGNPARVGSDGYDRLREIVEFGAEYQPPSGYSRFTRESFEGAHGVLIQ